jgi:hypothetical protein
MTDNARLASDPKREVDSLPRLLDKSGRASVDEGSCVQQEPSLCFGRITSLLYPKEDK